MARDYNRRGNTSKGSQGGGQVLLALTAFLIGYLTASVVDVNSVGHWIDNQVKNSQDKPQQPKQTAASEPRPQPQAAPKPKFEFYTLLTKEQRAANLAHQKAAVANPAAVQSAKPAAHANKPVNAANATTATSNASVNSAKATVAVTSGKPLPPTPAPAQGGRYVIQIAAFKAQTDAERIKAGLILKGYQAYITHVNTANGVWHRVMIGPYQGRQQADLALNNIARQERIKGILHTI